MFKSAYDRASAMTDQPMFPVARWDGLAWDSTVIGWSYRNVLVFVFYSRCHGCDFDSDIGPKSAL